MPPPAAGLMPGLMVPQVVSSMTPSVSVTPTVPSTAKGLNALLGLPTPSEDIFPPGTHASVPQLGKSSSDLELGKKESEESSGGEKSGADNQDAELVENGTEEIEIAEMVGEEGGENQMVIITETKTDGQVCIVLSSLCRL